MPHTMIDEIRSRKGEKVHLFFTIQNIIGTALGAVPAFLITYRVLPWYLTVPIVLAAAVVGFLATVEIGGMAAYERLVWWVRGSISHRMDQSIITPESLVGGRTVSEHEIAIPIQGPVRVVKRPARRVALPISRPIVPRARAVGTEETYADPTAQ